MLSFRGRENLADRKSTRLNSSHTVIYTLSLHDALPILSNANNPSTGRAERATLMTKRRPAGDAKFSGARKLSRSEEHTSELQSHSDLHSFPTRRSSDLVKC